MRWRLEKLTEKGNWDLKASRHSVHRHQTLYCDSDNSWQHWAAQCIYSSTTFSLQRTKNNMAVASLSSQAISPNKVQAQTSQPRGSPANWIVEATSSLDD